MFREQGHGVNREGEEDGVEVQKQRVDLVEMFVMWEVEGSVNLCRKTYELLMLSWCGAGHLDSGAESEFNEGCGMFIMNVILMIGSQG